MAPLSEPGRRFIFRLAVVGLASLLASPAFGQEALSRPLRAIFRPVGNDATHRLDLTASLSAASYESRYEIPLPDVVDPYLLRASLSTLTPVISYGHQGRRTGFAAAAGGSLRYYSMLGTASASYFARSRAAIRLGTDSEIRLRQGIAHSPYYGFDRSVDPTMDVEDLLQADSDQFIAKRDNSVYDGGVELGQRLTRRSRLTLSYTGRYADFRDGSHDLVSHRAGAGVSRQLTRHSVLVLGYGASMWSYPGSGAGALFGHDLYTGVNYSRPLAASRRTRVGLNAGTSVVRSEAFRVHVNGRGFLAHQIGRSWLVSSSYARGMDVLEGFSVPFFMFADRMGVSAGGRLNNRTFFQLTGSYSVGRFSVLGLTNRVNSVNGAATFHVALTSFLAADAQAFVGDYTFSRRFGLFPTTPTAVRRLGARIGITTWLPLVR